MSNTSNEFNNNADAFISQEADPNEAILRKKAYNLYFKLSPIYILRAKPIGTVIFFVLCMLITSPLGNTQIAQNFTDKFSVLINAAEGHGPNPHVLCTVLSLILVIIFIIINAKSKVVKYAKEIDKKRHA